MGLKESIVSDLTVAMKAKDADRVSVLRLIKASLMNRRIEKGSELDEGEVIKALQSLVKQRRDSAEQYENAGRPELAARETAEIAVIEKYLPASASEDEIKAAVEVAVGETGASTMRDMGAVMKAALAHLAGKAADGKMVSEAVRTRLS